MIFADKLILLRKKAGWSQEELADQMNVTRQSVSKWEGAQSVPDLEKMLRLSELFGVSTDYLLKDEIEEAEHSPCGMALQKIIDILRDTRRIRSVLSDTLPKRKQEVCGILVLKQQINLIYKDKGVSALRPVLRNTV